MNQYHFYLLGFCLHNLVLLWRGMLLRCRDDRKVIFRKFLDTVKLSRSFAHNLNWFAHLGFLRLRGFRFPRQEQSTPRETSGRHSLTRLLAKYKPKLKGQDYCQSWHAWDHHTRGTTNFDILWSSDCQQGTSYWRGFRAKFFVSLSHVTPVIAGACIYYQCQKPDGQWSPFVLASSNCPDLFKPDQWVLGHGRTRLRIGKAGFELAQNSQLKFFLWSIRNHRWTTFM